MTNETLADILDEMRTFGERCDHRPFSWQMVDGLFKLLAERIEAAAKRESGALVAEAEAAKDARNKVAVRLREEYAEKCKACKAKSGDAAAMRAALEKIVRIAEEWDTPGIHAVQTTLYRILEAARAALSAPPRNCDVGTPEEQAERYCNFTGRYNPCAYRGYARCAEDCPVHVKLTQEGHGELQCQLEWAQMPYEEGGKE